MALKRFVRPVFFHLIVAVLLIGTVYNAAADDVKRDFRSLAEIPVLDHGRVKPLDTFARAYLKTFNGKDTIDRMTALEWLTELIFDPDKAHSREIFNIVNPQVAQALGLDVRPHHRYSYQEVSTAIRGHIMDWHPLFMKPKEELTTEQGQLVALFNKTQVYEDISRTCSILFDDFEVPEGVLSETLGVNAGTRLTYLQVSRKDNEIKRLSMGLQADWNSKLAELSDPEKMTLAFIQRYEKYETDKNANLLRVIPSLWNDAQEKWFSPWGIIEQGYGSPQSAHLLRLWKELIDAYRQGRWQEWNGLSHQINQLSLETAGKNASQSLLKLEWQFNQFQPFAKSFLFYLTSFIFVLGSYLVWPAFLSRAAFLLVLVGFVLHFGGVASRMIIMHRPPVTSLYESILFVSLVGVLFGVLLELRKRNSLGVIIASFLGSFLHFLALRYDTDGDTMGMLVAVLNTNFWLSTHVVTITIGYGCCIVGGIMAHVYLFERIFKPNRKSNAGELFASLRGVCLVALFFSSLGTILGGIWADQSWGRFWGWDPKENGALLIVLWLAWLIHGRLAAKIGELEFVAGMVCTNVVVALAWFGVNLLSVGLHSYGFTDNAALNLFVFCVLEVLIAAGGYAKLRFWPEVRSGGVE